MTDKIEAEVRRLSEENLPRSIKDSGRAQIIWKALAPNTPGPRILKILSPPDATYESP